MVEVWWLLIREADVTACETGHLVFAQVLLIAASKAIPTIRRTTAVCLILSPSFLQVSCHIEDIPALRSGVHHWIRAQRFRVISSFQELMSVINSSCATLIRFPGMVQDSDALPRRCSLSDLSQRWELGLRISRTSVYRAIIFDSRLRTQLPEYQS